MNEITYIVIGMALVTYIPRMVPLVVISKVELPKIIKSWLKYIPVSILSTLLTIDLITYEETTFHLNNQLFLATIPTFLVAIKTKSLLKTVLTGITTMALLNLI